LDELNEQLALAETAQQDAHLDELDVEGLLAFAEEILARPSRFWVRGDARRSQQLQALYSGLTYEAGEFGTAKTSLIYRMLRAVEGV
jgi:hypothetical protein